MDLWYPEAKRSLLFPGCGGYVFGPFRGVLHHTEGDTLAGALATYPKTRDYPHFTLDEWTVEQHLPLVTGATALMHPTGFIDTNKASCIQIEIVGWTAKAAQMSDALCARLARLMRWIEAQTGIKSFYTIRDTRLTASEWRVFNGWCGHVHVPNNQHTDPGPIPLSKLFPIATPLPQEHISEREYEDVNLVSMTIENVKLGDKGSGWKGVPIDVNRIMSVIQHGSYQPTDGDWKLCKFAKQQREQDGYKSVIEITEGDPEQVISFEVWYIE